MKGWSALLACAIAGSAAVGGPCAASASSAPRWTAYDRPAQYGIVRVKNVPIVMRDGIELSANVDRPDKPGRYPVLVTQTPYGKDSVGGATGSDYLVQRGYVQVTVDVRGTGGSQGQWDSFGPAEQQDGADVVKWAAKQPWSDGKIGLDGPSYMGLNQLLTAALHPPHLRAIFPVVPMADGYRDVTFSGGDVNASFIPMWLGLITAVSLTPPSYALSGNPSDLTRAVGVLASHLQGAVNFQTRATTNAAAGGELAYDGPFWKTRSPLEVVSRVDVPAFVVGGLHDIFQRGEPLIYERLKRRVPARLVIGDWTHLTGYNGSGLPAPGLPETLSQMELRWFDRYLKGIDTRIAEIPKVTQYALGEGRFETQADWPLPNTNPTRMYLRGGKRLSGAAPATAEPSQGFAQQPVSGICTQSTSQWTMGLLSPLPCTTDDRANEAFGNAVYTTAPLTKPMRIDGPILADIWMTTTAADSAVTVRVTDVSPSGQSTELTDGWLAASFRAVDGSRSRYISGQLMQPWHPFTRSSALPVRRGQPTKLAIEVFPTNAVIAAGHSLRVAIGPADFPHQVPPVPQLANELGGLDQILTDPAHPSYVALPLPGSRCVRPHCRPLPVPNLVR